ncbi:MAG: hypothetical protein Q7T44_03855 [Parvibaculum sp.]|nr:hypothetical protein [Parvibaculum sp.]
MASNPVSKFFNRLRVRRRRDTLAQRHLVDLAERTLFLQGQIAAKAIDPAKKLACLSDAEFRVFSQWGEDGIVEWLVSQLDGVEDRFIEFGVETFKEANCRFLLENRNWKGLVLDGSENNMRAMCNAAFYWMHDITGVPAFVTAENINSLITEVGFAGPLGILSVDIDGNDYWVWRAIECVNPAIVICEVNPVLGDMHPVTVPYDPAFWRFNAHSSGVYFGASIAALRHLAVKKGYTFVGTSSTGINAFFVRNDLAAPVLAKLRDVVAHPPRHRDSRGPDGKLTHAGGMARFELIAHMPVVDVVTGETKALRDMGEPYSPKWLKAIV